MVAGLFFFSFLLVCRLLFLFLLTVDFVFSFIKCFFLIILLIVCDDDVVEVAGVFTVGILMALSVHIDAIVSFDWIRT